MGCCRSHPENASAIDGTIIDIPLLNKPRVSHSDLNDSGRCFSLSHYTTDHSSVSRRRPSYEGIIIEHNTRSVVNAPEMEQSRQQKFNECFSQIEANTFQNIPIMSVQSHLSVPNIDSQIMNHDFEDYNRFMNQVVDTLLVPLMNMKITSEESLVVVLSDE